MFSRESWYKLSKPSTKTKENVERIKKAYDYSLADDIVESMPSLDF